MSADMTAEQTWFCPGCGFELTDEDWPGYDDARDLCPNCKRELPAPETVAIVPSGLPGKLYQQEANGRFVYDDTPHSEKYPRFEVEGDYDEAVTIAAEIVKRWNAYPELVAELADGLSRMGELLETDCECDNTHTANGTRCWLCDASAALAKARGESNG